MIATKSQSRKYALPHAIERSIQRYGDTSKRRCKIICANIRGNRNVVQLCTTQGRTRYACFDREEWFFVVYCPVTDMIVTFLPLDAPFHYEKMILRNSPIYQEIGVDSFGVLGKQPVRKPYCVGCTDEAWGVKLNLPKSLC